MQQLIIIVRNVYNDNLVVEDGHKLYKKSVCYFRPDYPSENGRIHIMLCIVYNLYIIIE